MDEIKITVKSTEEKFSDKAKKKYLVVEAEDGKKYTLWGNHDQWKLIEKGFKLRLAGEQKGDFWNVSAFYLDLDKEPEPMKDYPGYKEKVYKADPIKQASIQRQTALNRAIDLVVADKASLMETFTWANRFNSWLEGEDIRLIEVELPEETTAVKPAKKKEDKTECKTIGDLFNACKGAFNMTPAQVLKELGLSSKEEIADPQDAYNQIKEIKNAGTQS